MKKILSLFSLPNILAAVGVISLYGFTRFITLKSLPIFLDELLYARWAQVGFYDGSQRLLSLSDGKQPLFIWIAISVMHSIANPILSVRLVSVASGLVTALGIGVLSFELFGKKWVAYLSVFLYILFPFALTLNRLGIFESLVGMLLIWTLYGEILLAKYVRLDIALILGMLFGLNLLTKTSGLQVIYFLPTTLLLAKFGNKKDFGKWVVLSGVAIGLGYLISCILYLSPYTYMISEKNYIFIYHFSELIPYGAFFAWGKNLVTFLTWLVAYFTLPLSLLLVATFVFCKQFFKEKLLLFFWFVAPVIALGLFGRILYPRYLYQMTLPLFPLISIGIYELYKKTSQQLTFGIVALCVVFIGFVDYKILTDLPRSPLPQESLFEYANGWPSGEGIKEMVTYLTAASTKQKIFVAAEGKYGGLVYTALDVYFMNDSQIIPYGFDLGDSMPLEFSQRVKEMPVYIVFNQTQKIPSWPMDLVLEKRKGIGNYYLRMYKLRKSEE